MPSQRIRELLAERGHRGGKTITDDYVRDVRPLFLAARTHQRTSYRPAPVSSGPAGAIRDEWRRSREA